MLIAGLTFRMINWKEGMLTAIAPFAGSVDNRGPLIRELLITYRQCGPRVGLIFGRETEDACNVYTELMPDVG